MIQSDYIILGAGSAGCIIASNLAKSFPHSNILLVEAGDYINPNDEIVWDPKNWVLVAKQPDLAWANYCSIEQKYLKNRRIDTKRAKGLGGCSMHNAMVYVRGGKIGFDNWEREGCIGWNYENNLPFFQQVEKQLNILIAEEDVFFNDLSQSCKDYNIPYNDNYNINVDQACVSPFQFCIKDNKRETTKSVFLNDPLPNLKILTQTIIKKIVLDESSQRIQKVEVCTLNDSNEYIHEEIIVGTEVVLSCGTMNNPQILMLSGIGDKDYLNSMGLSCKIDLPGVGQNLQDDLFVTAGFKSKKPLPEQPYGLMGAVIFDHSGFLDPSHSTDIECSLASGSMIGMDLPAHLQQSYWIYPNIQLLQSRGSIKLKDTNPFSTPIIDPNYLASTNDLQRCILSLELARNIGKNMIDWFEEEIFFDITGSGGYTNKLDEDNIEDYIRSTADTCHHFVGTCKMGIDEMSVVDPETLLLKGVQNLRVIDASIIPTAVSGNSAAATMMIAAKGSELISNNYSSKNE